ncbi:MAG: FAD-dependent oxidoreductase [Cyanobacteria bacterium J06626_18]
MSHIVVVGAGPAGAAIALLLARQGIQVTLLDQEPGFDRVFRGEGLMPSAVDALYQMGLGDCFEQIPSRSLDGWDFYVDQQRQMRVSEPKAQLAERSPRIVSQSALLEWIVKQAQQYPSFKFLPGWQVRELIQSDTGVEGVRAAHGEELRDFQADLIIATDGRYSRLRKQVGLYLQKARTQFDVLWFKLPAPSELMSETFFTACLQWERQFAFYLSWDKRLQIGWIVEKGQAKTMHDRDWIEEFAQAVPAPLAEHFRQHRHELEGPIFLDVIVGVCEQWSVPGLLLLGDAAHPMAPNRAQGINMALRDAIVAANHLVPLFSQVSQAPSSSQLNQVLEHIQLERLPEIKAAQQQQLAEWQRIAYFWSNRFTYLQFKLLLTVLGRFRFTQNAWLEHQHELRHGVLSVELKS